MNDLDLLAFALAEESIRRKKLELEIIRLNKELEAANGKAKSVGSERAEG